MTQKSEANLVRGLGIIGLTASIFNCTVGGGIFKLPGSVYALVGTAAPIVYLICFVAMALIVGVFIQVGKHITVSGGPYAYVQPVLGPYVGFLCGVLVWCLAAFAMASVASAYAGFVGALAPALSGGVGQAFTLAITLGALAAFNVRGVESGSRISFLLSVAKLLPLLVLIGAGIPHINQPALALPETLDWSAIGRGAMVLIFAFTGVESALIPSGEIDQPQRTLPRAMGIAMVAILFLYLGVQFVTQSALGDSMSQALDAPLAAAGEKILGPSGRIFLLVGAILSTAGYLSAMTLSLPRTLLAFAQDGYLPKAFASLHSQYKTPAVAIVAQAAFTFLLAASSQFERLAVLANLSAILMYLICVAAAIRLQRDPNRRPQSLAGRAVPWLAIIPMGFLLTSVTAIEWASVGALLVLASGAYLWKSRMPAAVPEKVTY